MTPAEPYQSDYEGLVESAPDAIVVIDGDGRIVLVNAQTERLFGYDRAELLGQQLEVLVPGRFRTSHIAHRGDYFADPRPRPMGIRLDLWARRRDGSEFPIDVSLGTITGEGGPRFAAFVRDITERRAAEEAIRDNEDLFALLASNVADYAIFLLDLTGHVHTWNAGAERMKGYPAEEILGRHFSVFYPPEDVAARSPERALEAARATGAIRDEGWRVRRDGSGFWADVSITALRDEHGNLRGFGKVVRDTTERRAAQARVEALNEIGRAVLEVRPGSEVLQLTAGYARQLAGGSAAWLVTPDAGGRSMVVSAADGPRGERLIGTTFPVDSSLSGDAMRTGHAVSISDMSSEKRAPSIERGMGFGPAVFVPLTGQGHSLGVLVVARDQSTPHFTAAQVALVELFAAQAALALSYSQARAELERIGMVEDRERIARNLHDTVIQRLFATGMALEGTAPLVERADVQERLGRAVDDLDETIRAIRTTIFELEERRQVRPGLRREILDVVSEAAANLGFEPVVRFEGAIDVAVSGEIATQLLPTLREALSNVVQHAQATRVEITVETSDELRLRVIDNGVGVRDYEPSSGHGLRNMRQRAEALGGGLDVVANMGGGTALAWHVPTTGGSAP